MHTWLAINPALPFEISFKSILLTNEANWVEFVFAINCIGTKEVKPTTDAKVVFAGIFLAKACFDEVSIVDDDKFVSNASDSLEFNFVKSFDEIIELIGKPFTLKYVIILSQYCLRDFIIVSHLFTMNFLRWFWIWFIRNCICCFRLTS